MKSFLKLEAELIRSLIWKHIEKHCKFLSLLSVIFASRFVDVVLVHSST